jgi:hypothetical protein
MLREVGYVRARGAGDFANVRKIGEPQPLRARDRVLHPP